MNATTIILAEDNPMMAAALQQILEADCELVATVADGIALVEAARKHSPDVIVADVSMPLLSGLEAAKHIKESGLRTRIIVLTMHADASIAKKAFESGASGYVLKQSAVKELIVAIREVASGNRYVTPLITGDSATFFKEIEV